jgi:amino acid permease
MKTIFAIAVCLLIATVLVIGYEALFPDTAGRMGAWPLYGTAGLMLMLVLMRKHKAEQEASRTSEVDEDDRVDMEMSSQEPGRREKEMRQRLKDRRLTRKVIPDSDSDTRR